MKLFLAKFIIAASSLWPWHHECVTKELFPIYYCTQQDLELANASQDDIFSSNYLDACQWRNMIQSCKAVEILKVLE